MQASMQNQQQKSDGYYRVFCPRYKVPALTRLAMSMPMGSQVKVCSVRARPCEEGCIESACALH